MSTPALGWLLPVIIEGGAVTAALLAWRRTTNGLSARPERTALVVLMVLAVCVNAHHATGGSVLGVVLAAAPPLILVVSIELLLRDRAQVKAESPAEVPERSQEAPGSPGVAPAGESVEKAALGLERAPKVSAERSAVSATERPKVSGENSTVSATEHRAVSTPKVSAPNAWAELSATERHARVEQALAEDPDLTGARLASVVGCGASTARRLLAQAREQAA